MKTIPTSSVANTIKSMNANKVLNSHHPTNINNSEKSFPRCTRSTLAQLRSGYSNYLNSYKARINPEIEDKCPHCPESHTTNHLFNCVNNPTTLSPRDLWDKPQDVSRFLNLVEDDDNPG